MKLITHILAGLTINKLLGLTNPLNNWLIITGSALPDIDNLLGLKHRTITHSLLMLITLISPPLGLGVLTHLVLDLLTITGCQLLWPKREWFIILGAPLRTGKHDVILIILLTGVLML